MAVSGVSSTSGTSYLQTAGKYSAIAGTVVSAACFVLGKDYIYPATIANIFLIKL